MTPAVGGTEHAAWGSEYDLRTNEVRAMDVVSNSFCAGGIPLGNGTWLNGTSLPSSTPAIERRLTLTCLSDCAPT